MDAKYRLFRSGQTVVDLASLGRFVTRHLSSNTNPGLRTRQLVPSTPPVILRHETPGDLQNVTQVAMERTRPRGKVIGIDLIPAQPPRGVATFQGDFLSPTVQALVKDFITRTAPPSPPGTAETAPEEGRDAIDQPSYIDRERHMGDAPEQASGLALVDVSFARYFTGTKRDWGWGE